MGLSALLNDTRQYQMSDDQGKWRQFILDHLDYIAQQATTYQISATLMNMYRYDLRRFLKEDRNRNEDMAWIVLLLNYLPNDFSFVDIKTLIVPTDDLIINLYHKFLAVNQAATSSR
jgi:hypothetical protein